MRRLESLAEARLSETARSGRRRDVGIAVTVRRWRPAEEYLRAVARADETRTHQQKGERAARHVRLHIRAFRARHGLAPARATRAGSRGELPQNDPPTRPPSRSGRAPAMPGRAARFLRRPARHGESAGYTRE